jgi:hypothetical protein
MAKYRIYLTTTSSAEYIVEAEDEFEAEEKLYDVFGTPSLCAQCSGWGHFSTGLQYVELGEDWEVEGDIEPVEE